MRNIYQRCSTALIFAVALTGCAGQSSVVPGVVFRPQASIERAVQGASVASPIDLSNWNDASLWMKANNHPFYGVDWRADHAVVSGSQLTINLDTTNCPSNCMGKPYASGQLVTKATYGYGLFEVDMKTARQTGLNNAFFTYVDPTGLGINDEIDIEILGENTQQMLATYYSKGVEEKSTPVNLGFDSASAFHHYGINWTPQSIQWLVDGKVLLTDSASSANPLPTTPTYLFAELWTAGNPGTWFGSFVYTGRVHARFANARFTPYK